MDEVYRLPDFQNEYGGGNSTHLQKLQMERTIWHDYAPYYSFGPQLDGRQVVDADGITRAFKANDMMDLYQTGMIYNTNVAVEGGGDKTTVRFSYTNTSQSGIVSTNQFDRNSFALRATQKVGKFINTDFPFYALSKTKNPMQQGGQGSLLYRLAYSNSRNYPIDNLFENYIDKMNGGRTQVSPYLRVSIPMTWTIYQTDVTQKENNLLANLDITANITNWLNLLVRGNVNSIDVNQNSKSVVTDLASTAAYGRYQI
jgi:iron complex outermembrane receptor protein